MGFKEHKAELEQSKNSIPELKLVQHFQLSNEAETFYCYFKLEQIPLFNRWMKSIEPINNSFLHRIMSDEKLQGLQ